MLIEYFLHGWHRSCSGLLKQYHTPGKWIGGVSPYPLIHSKEGLQVAINTSVWECIWVMEASRDTNYVVDDTQVVWKDDDLVKWLIHPNCDGAWYAPEKTTNIVIYDRRTLHHANQVFGTSWMPTCWHIQNPLSIPCSYGFQPTPLPAPSPPGLQAPLDWSGWHCHENEGVWSSHDKSNCKRSLLRRLPILQGLLLLCHFHSDRHHLGRSWVEWVCLAGEYWSCYWRLVSRTKHIWYSEHGMYCRFEIILEWAMSATHVAVILHTRTGSLWRRIHEDGLSWCEKWVWHVIAIHRMRRLSWRE